MRPSQGKSTRRYRIGDACVHRDYGRMVGVAHAEICRSATPLLVEDPTIVGPAIHG